MTIAEHLRAIAEELERETNGRDYDIRVARALISLTDGLAASGRVATDIAAFRRAAELAEQEGKR